MTVSTTEKVDQGSPPRVRGTAYSCLFLAFYARITPAGAGNSRATTKVRVLVRDHPRGCGEQRYQIR